MTQLLSNFSPPFDEHRTADRMFMFSRSGKTYHTKAGDTVYEGVTREELPFMFKRVGAYGTAVHEAIEKYVIWLHEFGTEESLRVPIAKRVERFCRDYNSAYQRSRIKPIDYPPREVEERAKRFIQFIDQKLIGQGFKPYRVEAQILIEYQGIEIAGTLDALWYRPGPGPRTPENIELLLVDWKTSASSTPITKKQDGQMYYPLEFLPDSKAIKYELQGCGYAYAFKEKHPEIGNRIKNIWLVVLYPDSVVALPVKYSSGPFCQLLRIYKLHQDIKGLLNGTIDKENTEFSACPAWGEISKFFEWKTSFLNTTE